MKKITILVLMILCISCKSSDKNDYNISDFGAKGDSLTINTTFIQKAIDVCSKNGGGKVLITNGIYISGTVLLKNNVTLHIDENAKLIGSSNPLDYQSIDTFVDATGQERGNCLVGAKGAFKIGISGKGVIDGNGKAFLHEQLKQKKAELNLSEEDKKGFGSNRPFLLRFVESSIINLENIHLRQPAAWTCHLYQSHDISIDNVKIYSHANHNNDGIDLDSSSDVTITNCDINTGDDAICVKSTSPKPSHNITVNNCKLKSDWGALKFGTESMGDFHNILIKDCKIYDTKGGGIKLLSVDGANMYDISIDNIEMDNVDMPIFIRLGERLRTYRNAEKQAVGTINNVSIKNIKATTRNLDNSRVNPPAGIFITGTPNHKINKIALENIHITLPGSDKEFEQIEVEEQETAYPEFNFFKVLPAYGLYGRHIESLELNNVKFNLLSQDSREEIIFSDVDNQNIKK